MRILVIGGSQFVGLAIVEEALRRGHDVTLFNRGKTVRSPVAKGVCHLVGDRDSDLSALCSEEKWDATIDVCCYGPNQVDLLADALCGRGGKHLFVSTVSVYARDAAPGSNEDSEELIDLSPVLDCDTNTIPINFTTYGPLKRLCEQRVEDRYSDALIIRPTYVIGSHDYTMRFPKWLQRIEKGGVIECPEPRDGPVQYIDARDLASFVLHLVEHDAAGFYNALAPSISFSAMLEEIVRVVGTPATQLQWVSCEDEEKAIREFPLWLPVSCAGLMQLNHAKAFSAGLVCRPLDQTIRDTLAWLHSQQDEK